MNALATRDPLGGRPAREEAVHVQQAIARPLVVQDEAPRRDPVRVRPGARDRGATRLQLLNRMVEMARPRSVAIVA